MRQNAKRGFTMLELVIALAIVGITGIMTAHFLWPLLGDYEMLSRQVDAKYLCDTLFDRMEEELRFGRDFAVADNGGLRFVIVTEDGGKEVRRSRSIYDSGTESYIPDGCFIEVKYETDDKLDMVTMTMRVYADDPEINKGRPLFQQDAVIRSLYPVQ